jgi:hypothetical protein
MCLEVMVLHQSDQGCVWKCINNCFLKCKIHQWFEKIYILIWNSKKIKKKSVFLNMFLKYKNKPALKKQKG